MASTTAPRDGANTMAALTGSAPQYDAAVPREKVPERQRGLFNFLTWPFFLAPIMADPHVVGGFARAAMASEEQARSQARAEPNADPSGELPALTDHANSVDEPSAAQASAGSSELPDPRVELMEPPGGYEPSDQAKARSTADNDAQSASSGGGSASQASEQMQSGIRAHTDADMRADHASGSATSPAILGSDSLTASVVNLPGAVVATPLQALDQAGRVDLAHAIGGMSALSNAVLSHSVSEIPQSATTLATSVVQATVETAREASGLVVSASEPLLVVFDALVTPVQSVQTIINVAGERNVADVGKLAAPEELLQGAVSTVSDFGIASAKAASDLMGELAGAPVSSALKSVADGIRPTETFVQTIDVSLDAFVNGAARTSTTATEAKPQATIANAVEVVGDTTTLAGAPFDDAHGEDHLIASAGSITFPAATGKHEIIENGRYTDYGIALKAGLPGQPAELSGTDSAQPTTRDLDTGVDDSTPTASTVKDVAERANELVAGVDEIESRLGDHLL